jgi:hypothetical protein
MVSNLLGSEPLANCSSYSRQLKKYLNVPQPDIVKKYNSNMGGVDRLDQNINHHRIKIGGKKWYYPILTWLLDTAVQNSWQLHKKAGGRLSALDFRREIVCPILRSAAEVRKRNPSGPTVGIGRLANPGEEEVRYDCVGHFLIVKRNIRKLCSYEECKTKCQTYCEKCNRAICADHFKIFHTKFLVQ